MFINRLSLAGPVIASGILASVANANLTFTFTSTGNAAADQGFAAAGQLWSNVFADNITINFNASFAPLDPGVLGGANGASSVFSYSTIRTALTNDQTTADDTQAVASLPAGSSLSFVTNLRNGSFVLDNNGSGNNQFLDVNRANAKALGLISANDASVDATIQFSTLFTYDFDRSDGITPGSFDFVGIAAHEIGHALGFVSGVDIIDQFSGPNGPNANTDINGAAAGIGDFDGFAIYSVLDLFRYTTETQGSVPDLLDLGYGGTPYLSFDNGTTSVGLLSDGAFNGDDGRQASHWKDNLGLGIMDPTFAPGELGVITTRDLRAFDAIGYDLVPEPASLTLVGLGLVGLLKRRRQRD